LRSLEQAASERGQAVGQVVRCILFRLGRDGEREWVLVATAGPDNLPWKALRAHLGRSRISMATPEEVLAVTGAPVGAVSPFTLRPAEDERLRLIIEPSVLAHEEVSLGSGERGVGIVMQSADLRDAMMAMGAEVVALKDA
jgi:Ala-tRNA(Pro) deacylase